jgi:hypothetical protein
VIKNVPHQPVVLDSVIFFEFRLLEPPRALGFLHPASKTAAAEAIAYWISQRLPSPLRSR